MLGLHDKIGILAEEIVYGPGANQVPLVERARDTRLASRRDELQKRFGEICTELRGPSREGEGTDIESEGFRSLRNEFLSGWTSPLLALDREEAVEAGGRRLFGELRATLTEHVHFPEDWEYDVAALYVFQCYLGDLLPAFFYALIDGTRGAGKTTLLDHLSRLTGSLRLQSFTLATLSRSMTRFRPVSIDEFDATEKNPEMGSAAAALVRQGYKRDAAPRLICAPKSNEILALEIAGPKAVTFRSDLDDALKDRGFRFPMAAGANFRLVVLGMAPEFGDLAGRLKAWAGEAHEVWSFERVCATIKEPSFETAVRSVLGRTGATRGAELMTTALIVTRIAGIDLSLALREASGARERETGTSRGVEELLDALRALVVRAGPGLDASEYVVVAQTSVRAEIDRARKEQRLLPLKDGEFAQLRRDALIQDAWRVKVHGYPHWKIPKSFLCDKAGSESPVSPDSPEPQGDRVTQVSQVRPPLPLAAAGVSDAPGEPGSWQEPAVSSRSAPEHGGHSP
jgi:hypothetical protein